MMKIINTKFALWMILAVVVISSASPIQAAMNQNFLIQERQKTLKDNNHQLLALSWGDIWRKLRRKKGKKGSRGPNQPTLCMIAPAKLEDRDDGKESKATIEMWGTQPVFLWKGEIKGIEVRNIRSNELMWSQKFDRPKASSIVYQGKPLQPGQAYSWREIEPISKDELPNKQSFRIMKKEDRDRIYAELKQLENKGANPEEIILARIKYFAEKELWSDVFREIYLVQNPSPELKELTQQIQGHDFCAPDKDEPKVSLVSGE